MKRILAFVLLGITIMVCSIGNAQENFLKPKDYPNKTGHAITDFQYAFDILSKSLLGTTPTWQSSIPIDKGHSLVIATGDDISDVYCLYDNESNELLAVGIPDRIVMKPMNTEKIGKQASLFSTTFANVEATFVLLDVELDVDRMREVMAEMRSTLLEAYSASSNSISIAGQSTSGTGRKKIQTFKLYENYLDVQVEWDKTSITPQLVFYTAP